MGSGVLRKKSAGNAKRDGGSRIPICADTERPLSLNVREELSEFCSDGWMGSSKEAAEGCSQNDHGRFPQRQGSQAPSPHTDLLKEKKMNF